MSKKLNRVVHLTTGHTFDDTRVFRKQCVSLAKAGYQVTLVVPNEKSLSLNGVSIKAIRPLAGRFYRILLSPWVAFYCGWKERGDVYHLHDPNLIPIGLIIKMLGKKVIFDSHENYVADISAKEWIPLRMRHFTSKLYEILESFAVSKFDAVVTVNEATFNRFIGIAKSNVLIKNYPIISEITPLGDNTKNLDFVWVGMISPIRACHQLDAAFSKVNANLDIIGTPIDFKPRSENINLIGSMDQSAAFALASDYLAGIVIYLPEPNSMDALPNKLFEYMCLGLPVLASNFPHWISLVEDSGCGICVDPESVDEIREALNWFLENPIKAKKMGALGRQIVLDRLSWQSEEIKLLNMYREVL